jgi:type IV secretory pathway VirB2 component (pilin)
MVCQACGTQVAEGVPFCSKCGAQVTPAQPVYAAYPQPPMPMYVPRVHRHLQTLGILWCVFGVYRVVGGMMGMFFLRAISIRGFGGDWPFNNHYHRMVGPEFMGSLLPIIAVYTVIVSALALIVGYSLLTRRPWGRILAIVVGILTLFKPILGTALGIYTLWVLAPGASGLEYDSIADRS